MKILRITSIGYEGGGADNGIILLQPIFTDRGHIVKILTSNLHPELKHFSDFEFGALSYHSKIAKLFYRAFYPSSYFALKKILQQYQPDIVQLHTMYEVSPSVLFLLKNYPTVMTVHGAEDFTSDLILWNFPRDFFKDGSYSRDSLNLKGRLHYLYCRYISSTVYRLGFKNVDAFIAFSKYMQLELKKNDIESVHIPNATRLFDFSPIDLDSKIITYVGRLEKFKGVDYLIKAIPEIVKKIPDTQLFIAGTGDHENELKKIAKGLNIEDHIKFLGQQNRSQLYELYKRSAMIVVPSIWPEPFGKVGIEAMSVGRPVIASDVGGISEWLINEKTGYLVTPGKSEAITSAALKLFGDRTKLEHMALSARKQSEKFSLQHHADLVLELYAKIIVQHNQKGK
jgi:glycosyltransferase involved in cell wall biosynthesis